MKTVYLMALLTILSPFCLNAAVRASTNYSVTAQTMDCGGGSKASSTFAFDSSFGIFSAARPSGNNVSAAAGFTGQLAEIVTLSVVGSSTNIDEGGMLQLSCAARYNDNTFSDVTGSGAQWLAASPLTIGSPNGLVRAGKVYQNTPGMVQASFLGFTASTALMVINTNNDDYGSYARDGMDDAWQVQYFGMNNTNANPLADPDGDGQTNALEYLAGTSPTDGSSRFRLNVTRVPGAPTWKRLVFSPRQPNRTYQLEYSTNLDAGNFNILAGQPVSDAGTTRTVTDQTATNGTRFYRVRIAP